MSNAETISSYNTSADLYDRRWRDYLTHTHDAFLRELDTGSDDVLLDISCGTGLLGDQLLKRDYPFEKLVLNDPATAMLDRAKERTPDRPDIRYTSHALPGMPYGEAHFTKICCLSALHNYPEQQQVVRECYRLLKPGGQLFILDWNRKGLFSIVNWVIRLLADERIDTRSSVESAAMLSEAGFETNEMNEWYYRYWHFYYAIARKPE